MVREGEKVLIRKGLVVNGYYTVKNHMDQCTLEMSMYKGFFTIDVTGNNGTRFLFKEDHQKYIWNLAMVIDLKPFMKFLGGLK